VSSYLFNVKCGLGRCFHEDQPVLFSESVTFLGGDLSSGIEVALVADEHNCHVRVAILPHFLEPPCQMVEGVTPTEMFRNKRYLVIS
jgi:hypothetical protein